VITKAFIKIYLVFLNILGAWRFTDKLFQTGQSGDDKYIIKASIFQDWFMKTGKKTRHIIKMLLVFLNILEVKSANRLLNYKGFER
jgi:hypothetical protein